jgi:hypothetical protein
MTELDVYRPREVAVADTDSWTTVLAEVADLASKIADTPFVPDGLRGSVPAVAAAILTGRELGLPPLTSLANIHVIKGKPALSAALMRALILAQGHQIETVDISDTRAVIRGRRRGEAVWEEASFTADQAKRAGIVLGGYPQDKLYARATSRLARRKFADVIAGMPYSAEELDDGPEVDTATGEVIAVEQPGPRTAQRRQRTQSPPPAPAAAPSAAPAAPPAGGAGGDLPPLPGEDEPAGSTATEALASVEQDIARDAASPLSARDAPGSVTTHQLTAIWTVLSQVYHFGPDEKDQARGVCAQILQVELSTSTMLSKAQAGTVIDTLQHWERQAAAQGDDPRGYLMLMLQAAANGGEVPGE